MTLDDLFRIGQLKVQSPNDQLVKRHVILAKIRLQDAKIAIISKESRFCSAYKCIYYCALAALNLESYGPNIDRPGTEKVVLSTLGLTLGVEASLVSTVDAFRREFFMMEYSAKTVTESQLEKCIQGAESILLHFKAQISQSTVSF